MSLQIREIDESDYDKGYLSLLSQLNGYPFNLLRKQFIDRLRLSLINSKIYVIEDNNRIIATAKILFEPKFRSERFYVGHIEDVVVDQDYRGRKIGNYLLTHLTNIGRQYGCYKMILDCKNEITQFYQSCGLTNVGSEMEIRFR